MAPASLDSMPNEAASNTSPVRAVSRLSPGSAPRARTRSPFLWSASWWCCICHDRRAPWPMALECTDRVVNAAMFLDAAMPTLMLPSDLAVMAKDRAAKSEALSDIAALTTTSRMNPAPVVIPTRPVAM
ncbi:hypothetical protein H310_07357 [Aphanomyces invadans]|uniref:Uncharacterized protein n=1 Tax=Aphanomyces invadans TaxID=157072 RepID=A0A024U340_9STRA|nr:hypothetical protein H310_07357 [Aphanomyces invadans]ETW00831.1 hypothetical protein H310_07357 [Aphanomyces invadans]|eukprot:XP_008870966.1 hypothetical protein H310_07357 [Aphanomyces invadans]